MTYQSWPIGQIPTELRRPELLQIRTAGYDWTDPYDVVDIFEKKVATFAGSEYAVAIDSCSNGLFLLLKYFEASGTITIPKHTYVSVPMQIIHAGCKVQFVDIDWFGSYQLLPYPIWDAAIQWREGMFNGSNQVLSFQIKKFIPIGRGGMVLTNNKELYSWLKKARHDGRDLAAPYVNDQIQECGWHYYMTPEDAARGILLMDAINTSFEDRPGKELCIDISNIPAFRDHYG